MAPRDHVFVSRRRLHTADSRGAATIPGLRSRRSGCAGVGGMGDPACLVDAAGSGRVVRGKKFPRTQRLPRSVCAAVRGWAHHPRRASWARSQPGLTPGRQGWCCGAPGPRDGVDRVVPFQGCWNSGARFPGRGPSWRGVAPGPYPPCRRVGPGSDVDVLFGASIRPCGERGPDRCRDSAKLRRPLPGGERNERASGCATAERAPSLPQSHGGTGVGA